MCHETRFAKAGIRPRRCYRPVRELLISYGTKRRVTHALTPRKIQKKNIACECALGSPPLGGLHRRHGFKRKQKSVRSVRAGISQTARVDTILGNLR